MTTDDVDSLLSEAEEGMQKGDEANAGILLHQILQVDFTNDKAWKLLHQLLKEKSSLDDFKIHFAQKYYPDKVNPLQAVSEQRINKSTEKVSLSFRPNLVQFIPITCPNCGGDLRISDKQDEAICNYCGKPFLVRDNSRKAEVSIEKYLVLAKTALESNNSDEAYIYYSKALEIEPDNYIAWYGKAEATGWSSSLQSFNFDEATLYFEKAINFAPPTEKQRIQENSNICLAILCGVHALEALRTFQEYRDFLIDKLDDDVSYYNNSANILEAKWEALQEQTNLAIECFEKVLTNSVIKDVSRISVALERMIGTCEYILKNDVVKEYRIEYKKFETLFIPVERLGLPVLFLEKLKLCVKKYVSLKTQ